MQKKIILPYRHFPHFIILPIVNYVILIDNNNNNNNNNSSCGIINPGLVSMINIFHIIKFYIQLNSHYFCFPGTKTKRFSFFHKKLMSEWI